MSSEMDAELERNIDNSLGQSITEIQKRKVTSQSELDSFLESFVD